MTTFFLFIWIKSVNQTMWSSHGGIRIELRMACFGRGVDLRHDTGKHVWVVVVVVVVVPMLVCGIFAAEHAPLS
jgi:hypothetical protein